MKKKELKIFVVNYDWRNIFREDKYELFEKLQRDMLYPEVNSFFFFSWAHESYSECEGKWCTVHKKTYGLEKLRPFLNAWALFSIPLTAFRYKVKPDIWLVYDFGMVPAMWLASKLFGGTLIMYVNNQAQIYSGTRRFGKIKSAYSWVAERVGVRFVKHFFTINETMCAYLGSLGVPRDTINIYNVNTINRDKKFIRESKKGVVRKQYNLSEDTKVLVAVARLEAEKNYPLLIDLFSKLSNDYVLFCLGMGSLLPKLEEQAKKLGVENRVFFPGFIERKDIWNYYKDADVFVLLSKAEALGIVFWEAMYVQVPCVGSEVEGIMESLGKKGERGMIWKQEDGQEGFKELIAFCTTKSAKRDEMVARAKTFVDMMSENKTTINDFLKKIEEK